ncbi:MAG: hypothetical protein QOC92_248 [Acidimicrobiaceae bacterium]|jgi:Kef-type K+ transport system membrane component KefB/predicted amino acid-binding ACT domain protein
MNVSSVLFDILVVLIAAKLAAEGAERIGVPAVVGEILAGVVIGPSMLGLVGSTDETLRTLGEIGVILLLLEVGLEMDLKELGAVGRASMLVATVGVVSPMILGLGAMELLGFDFKTSLFVGAALTATSVGITARVFGDLRALATTEARIVLGAAVADDVMGLVVLTVVVRLVTEGSVSALSVAGIVFVAVAFLVIGTVAGLRLAPPLFGLVERVSRSTGTLVALGLAFTLIFAEVADAAKLAPIVGAFVAGLALARSEQSDRIRRELAPVGHLFIPVFFLQIGIDARIEAFTRPAVLRDASILLVVAVVGKLVSPLGAIGSPGDKLLIGLGMLPRGEVGLIFATIGLQQGVLDDDLYASLLLVVLVTTLVTPQLLKMRYTRLRTFTPTTVPLPNAPAPSGEWVRVALDAAVDAAHSPPSPELLDWLSTVSSTPFTWDRRATDALMRVVEHGNARSWRLLEIVGVLDKALPELAAALRSRQSDPLLLDPMSTHRWPTVERLRAVREDDPLHPEVEKLANRKWLLLGALLSEGLDGQKSPVTQARQVVRRLDLGAVAEQEIAMLVADRALLWSAARRADGLTEESVLQLASHLDKPEHARALYLLSVVSGDDRDAWEVERMTELHDLVQAALATSSLTGLEARNLVGRRRAEAARLVGGVPRVVERIEGAPRAYVLREDSDAIARHAQLLEPLAATSEARVQVSETDGGWWTDVAARDQPGLLASVTGALAGFGLDVRDAIVATWPDGGALESFRVWSDEPIDPSLLRAAIEKALGAPLASTPLPEATVTFDDGASPWHTVCDVTAPDKPGLLHALANAFAAAGIEVHSARISGEDGVAVDRFEVTDRDGRKLGDEEKAAMQRFVAGGVTTKRRRFRRATFAVTVL